MIYEINNPSDSYTLKTDDFEVATVACFMLGEGKYALDPIGEGEKVPLFIFSDPAEWVQKRFNKTVGELFTSIDNAKLADCLDSVLIGKPSAREDFESAMAAIEDPEKRIAYRAAWHDRKRSSLNDIGGYAYQLATSIRKKAALEPK